MSSIPPRYTFLLPVMMLIGTLAGCKPDVTGGELENIPPTVRLPNSMADSMYLPATSLIKWIGDDADGVVVGYSTRVDGGTWSHEGDNDGDWAADPTNDLNGNGAPDINWDGGFGLLGVDDDGDKEFSVYEDSSRYYGYSIRADEELPNGIDDDGDGRIDEDCWGNDDNRDGDCGYDPEPYVDEDPIDGQDNDEDGLVDEDPINRPRWVRALGALGEWTFWSEATQDTVRFPAFNGEAGDAHLFEVKSLDNKGAESEPVQLVVFTTTFLPVPEIVGGPADGREVFMWPDTTVTWHGVRYDLGGSDVHRDVYYNIIEDGRVVRWAYWLDDPDYVPSREEYLPQNHTVLFGAETGWHTLYVRCLDNAQAISDSVVSRRFYAANPTFSREILLVDGTYQPFPGVWDEVQIYENTLLADRDVTRATVPSSSPNSFSLQPSDFGDYKAVYWYKAGNEQDTVLAKHADLLAEYASLGGIVVIEGLRVLNNSLSYTLPATFEEGQFAYDWLGLIHGREPSGYPFLGAEPPVGGTYPTVHLSVYPALPATSTLEAREGADVVLTMVSADTTVHGLSNAVRYRPPRAGSTLLVFGFPLMYLEAEDLPALGQAILADLGL